jgi:hypothetical protein
LCDGYLKPNTLTRPLHMCGDRMTEWMPLVRLVGHLYGPNPKVGRTILATLCECTL